MIPSERGKVSWHYVNIEIEEYLLNLDPKFRLFR